MTTVTQSKPLDVKLVNHQTQKTQSYRIDPKDDLNSLLADIIDLDLSRAFLDGETRSLIITANPQEKH